MFIPKDKARQLRRFHLVDPKELATFSEWAEWLESLLHNACSVMEYEGELVLLEIKQLVTKVNGMRIEVYSNEHPPPHFHVKSAEVDASFSIEDCRRLKGKISASDEHKIKYWHRHAKPMLVAAWDSSRPTDCTVGPYGDA